MSTKRSKKRRKKRPELFFGCSGDPFPRNHPWTVTRVSADTKTDDGWCEADAHRIFLAKGLSKRDLAMAAIHEGLHAEFYYDLSETAVERASQHLVALLEYLKLI